MLWWVAVNAMVGSSGCYGQSLWMVGSCCCYLFDKLLLLMRQIAVLIRGVDVTIAGSC
jgi:hypothetical protein